MNDLLVLSVGAITYLSRLLPLGILPVPPPGLRAVLGRVPGPLFAGMAALYLVDAQGGLASLPILMAMVGALLTSPFRSLLITLAGGLAGYGLGVWILVVAQTLDISS